MKVLVPKAYLSGLGENGEKAGDGYRSFRKPVAIELLRFDIKTEHMERRYRRRLIGAPGIRWPRTGGLLD